MTEIKTKDTMSYFRRIKILAGMMTALAMFFSIALSSYGCSEAESTEIKEAKPVAEVEVNVVETLNDTGYFEAVGRVKNLNESMITAKVMGKIAALKIKAGDKVKKGDILIRIDAREIKGNVSQAEGALLQARAAKTIASRMLERYKKLKANDTASQAKYDKVKFDYDSALGAEKQALGALASAKSYLKETVVKAPFDGVIIDTMIEIGEMAAPGVPLLRMESVGELQFETAINSRDIDLVSIGQEAVLTLDGRNGEKKAIKGVVSEIVPSLDSVTHSNLVRIKLDEKSGIRPGAFGRARFDKRESSCNGVLIPDDRLVRHGQLSAVYVLDAGDNIRLRLVREGDKVGSEREILSGLTSGDRYVTSDISGLIDGQPGRMVD